MFDQISYSARRVARDLRSAFEVARREPETADGHYWRVREERESELHGLVYRVHDDGDILPDDYRYAYLAESLDAISEATDSSDASDVANEFANDGVDVYTSALDAWRTSSGNRRAATDEALVECAETIDQATMRAQAGERSEVFAIVLDHIGELCDAQLEEWEAEARELGVDAAKCAASWTCDGNGDTNGYRQTLAMLDAGDPAADDRLPNMPDLSGEMAGDPTPLSLTRDVTGLDDPGADVTDALATAWEEGVSETFTQACEAELHKWADDADADDDSELCVCGGTGNHAGQSVDDCDERAPDKYRSAADDIGIFTPADSQTFYVVTVAMAGYMPNSDPYVFETDPDSRDSATTQVAMHLRDELDRFADQDAQCSDDATDERWTEILALVDATIADERREPKPRTVGVIFGLADDISNIEATPYSRAQLIELGYVPGEDFSAPMGGA
jgi:hypothetical protein